MKPQDPRSESPAGITRFRVEPMTEVGRSQRYTEVMPVTIPDEVLAAARMSEPEIKRELALTLFQQEKLTLGQARRLAGMSHLEFQSLLAERQIPIHYGVDEFRDDLRTLRRLGQL